MTLLEESKSCTWRVGSGAHSPLKIKLRIITTDTVVTKIERVKLGEVTYISYVHSDWEEFTKQKSVVQHYLRMPMSHYQNCNLRSVNRRSLITYQISSYSHKPRDALALWRKNIHSTGAIQCKWSLDYLLKYILCSRSLSESMTKFIVIITILFEFEWKIEHQVLIPLWFR